MPDDERPAEDATPSPPDDGSDAKADASGTPAPSIPSGRRPPMRGTGAGFGVAGEGGGAAALLRRVKEAAELARRTAEEHRPAAERAAHEAAERAKRAAEAAKPEAERLARQARAAAEAARPHVERAAGEAVNFAREHEDEIRAAAARAAKNVAPRPLRPALDAMEEELRRKPAPEDAPPQS